MSQDKRAVGREELDAAAKSLAAQGKTFDVANIWEYLAANAASAGSKLDLANIIMSVGGAFLVIALPIILGLVADQYHFPAMFTGAIASVAVFGVAGMLMWHKYGLKLAGGLLSTAAVVAVPVATWGFLHEFLKTGMDYNVESLVVFGSLAAASVAALRAVRFPFLTMPLYGSLWVMSMIVIDMVTPSGSGWLWGWASQNALILDMVFGGLLCAAAFSLEKNQTEDFSFWGYLFGLTTFWFAWTKLGLGGEYGKLLFVAVNVGFILLSSMLKRTIFLVFGVVGTFWYPFYLSFQFFAENAIMLWVSVAVLGAGVLGLGVVYFKKRDSINNALASVLPKLR